MTITSPPQQADTVLARDYERLKPDILRTVRSKLAASGVRFDDSDLDGFYNQAWHGVHTKLAEGERVENVNGLLVTITQRRALDEFRALRAESRVDADALLGHGVDPDFASQVDDHTRLRQFIEGMRERLNGREREAAALCYVQDYSRPEAAQAMGIKPRRMEKIMDGVSKKVGAFVGDIERDEWCDARHSMIKAYALGLLDPEGERYALAQEHLESCPRCRRDVLRMRGIAALGPPPALLFLAAGAAGATGAAGAGGHALLHGGGVAAKSSALAAGGTLAVAATVAAVALTTHQKSEPPLVTPTPTPTVAVPAKATPAPAPTVVAKAPVTAPHKTAVKRHHKKKAQTTKPVVTAVPARTAVPTVVHATVPVRPAATPVAQKKPVSQDGAGEFELGSGRQR
jgi:DNA-directed RNA polymerase specialized sigma24 family protein